MLCVSACAGVLFFCTELRFSWSGNERCCLSSISAYCCTCGESYAWVKVKWLCNNACFPFPVLVWLSICVCFWDELFGGLCLLILLLYLNCRHIFCLHFYMAIDHMSKNVCLVLLIAWVLMIQVPCSVRVWSEEEELQEASVWSQCPPAEASARCIRLCLCEAAFIIVW